MFDHKKGATYGGKWHCQLQAAPERNLVARASFFHSRSLAAYSPHLIRAARLLFLASVQLLTERSAPTGLFASASVRALLIPVERPILGG